MVCCWSGGKDSDCQLHICKVAAKAENRLPVTLLYVDAEIALPGTHEHARRVAADPELDFRWMVSGGAELNLYDLKMPFIWYYDMRVDPDQWMQIPPDYAMWCSELTLEHIANTMRFPADEGKHTFILYGARAEESLTRLCFMSGMGGYVGRMNKLGAYPAYPLYDWKVGDVWRTITEHKLDYNKAYGVLRRLGMAPHLMRLSAIIDATSMEGLILALSRDNPEWFARLCRRVPGVEKVKRHGGARLTPTLRPGESNQACFDRILADPATPAWVVTQGKAARRRYLARHASHTTDAFPDAGRCFACAQWGCWADLLRLIYTPLGYPHIQEVIFANDFRPKFAMDPPYATLKADPWYDEELIFHDEDGTFWPALVDAERLEKKLARKAAADAKKEKKCGKSR